MMANERKSSTTVDQSLYWTYLRPIVVLSNVAGCYCCPLKKEFAHCLRLYSILTSVLLLYSIYRGCVPLFNEPLRLNATTLFKFFFLAYFALCLICQLFMSFSSTVMMKVLQAVDCGNNNTVKERSRLKKLAIFTFQSVIFKMVTTFVTMGLCVFQVIKITYIPDIIPGGPKYLLLIPTFFGQTALSVSMGLFTIVCAILCVSFRSISTEIEHASAEMIRVLQQRYQSLVNATRAVDGYFSSYIFLFYALTLPLMCFILYAIIRSDGFDFSSKLILIFWISVSAINLLLVSVPAILLYEEGQRPLEALFKLYNREASRIDALEVQQFHMFVELITHSQVSISGGRFFIVTRAMILTLVSVVVSYLLIILQFAMEQECNCPVLRNITI